MVQSYKLYIRKTGFFRTPLKHSVGDINIKNLIERVNSFYFREKEEIIVFLLFFYIQISEQFYTIDEHNDYLFVELLPKKGRIIVYLEEKYFSVYLPFSINRNNDSFKITSREIKSLEISKHVLRILKSFFEKNICGEYRELTMVDLDAEIEDILEEYCKDNNLTLGITTSEICKLALELLKYDTSYVRFDIDYINCKEKDGSLGDKFYKHPPFHLDTDYRDLPSYKIGIDSKFKESEFKDLFDEQSDCHFIKKSFKPQRRL